MPDERPNILWICTDQQRFDSLGCYGNEFVETPHIDQLADSGVQFNHAYSQSPICTPSRASFLTGRYPRTTRARQNGQSIPDDEYLITRRFADEGYTCGLSGKHHLAPGDPTHEDRVPHAERRIDDGYANFHWSHSSRQPFMGNEYREDWLQERDIIWEDTPFEGSDHVMTSIPAEHHQTTWCVQKAINFIEFNEETYDMSEFGEDADEPWLFSVNIFDPHHPFDPPEEYLERYMDRLDEIPLPNYEDGELEDKPFFQRDPPGAADTDQFPFDEMSAEDHRLVRAAYWAMIDLIDDQVGRLLETLEQTGQRENTIVIFMSDHGEMLGDHGVYLKGPFFYEPAIRVPLIISGPGIQSGVESNALIELVDLAPTLLDATNFDHHTGMQGDSFWPLLSGDGDIDRHRDDVYCEYYHGLERPRFYDAMQEFGLDSDFHRHFEETDVKPEFHEEFLEQDDRILPYATMVRSNRYKLVHYHSLDTGELYDLSEDPTETHNLWNVSSYQDVKSDMLERLSNRMAQTIDPLPQRLGRW